MSEYKGKSLDFSVIVNKILGECVNNLQSINALTFLNNQLWEFGKTSNELPELNIPLMFSNRNLYQDKTPLEIIGNDFTRYNINHAIIITFTAIEDYLVKINAVHNVIDKAEINNYISTQNEFKRIYSESINNRYFSWEKVLKPKIPYQFDDSKQIDLYKSFETLKSMRNCIVHRFGTIKELDIEEDKDFEVYWLNHKIFAGDKEIEVTPFINNTDKYLPFSIRQDIETKSFKRGEKININLKEYNDISLTLLNFCNHVAKISLEILKERIDKKRHNSN